MDRDYAGVIKRKLDDVYRTGGASATASTREKIERESRQSFIVSTTAENFVVSHLTRLPDSSQ